MQFVCNVELAPALTTPKTFMLILSTNKPETKPTVLLQLVIDVSTIIIIILTFCMVISCL